MSFNELHEGLPIPGVFLAFALLALLLYEVGFRIDIDRPRGGTLTVSQESMIDLQERMERGSP